MENTPENMDKMVKTLAEIKVDTEPDESADYWQERH